MEVKEILGISNQKFFQRSHTNLVGIDLSTYRIVRNNEFAFNRATTRNGDRISIALRKGNDCVVSPSYRIFKIIDENKLLSDYLMMWFRRPEFDRYARFKSHGSAHEFFEYEQMCDIELPIPHIDKQRQIVAEYHTIVNRINLNKQLILKLEETAQTIYKQWFVDFDFPDENGLPYKTNGGKLVESELGEIPRGWGGGSLNDLVEIIDGDRGTNYPSIEEMSKDGFCLFLNAGNVTKIGFDFSENNFITKEKDKKLRKGKLKRNDIVLTSRGTVGNVGFFSDSITFSDIRINSGMVIMRARTFSEVSIFVYSMLRNYETKKSIENYLSGSAQPQLPIKDLIKIPILLPSRIPILNFSKIAMPIQRKIDVVKMQNIRLKEFSDLLLSKLATVDNDVNGQV